MLVKDFLWIFGAYLLGGICFGYYLVRWKLHVDIRDQGSGSVGARNVGRFLGRPGFIATILGDTLKGVLAIAAARYFHVSPIAVSLCVFAVIAGHIWPVSLQFRGGRGAATAVGAFVAYAPPLALVLLGTMLVFMVFRRGFVMSGLAAFLLLPIGAYALQFPAHSIAALTASSAIVLFAHRDRIRKAFAAPLPAKEA